MQILLIISFACMVLAAFFIGQALSGGYVPYPSFIGAALYLGALFMPFLSEYNVLHRGYSKIGDNFKNLIGTKERVQGEMEIILPGDANAPAEKYDFEKNQNTSVSIIILLVTATLLMGYDIVTFYFLEEALKTGTGPISNF